MDAVACDRGKVRGGQRSVERGMDVEGDLTSVSQRRARSFTVFPAIPVFMICSPGLLPKSASRKATSAT
jgi:hypothetical protein